MVTYTVHEPPNPPADRLDRAQAVVFLKDGFNLGAALLGPVWLLARRLWIGLALYAVGLGVMLGFLKAMGAAPIWFSLVIAAVHVLIGFEGSELERSQKESDGWALLGSVEGRNEIECERRFFDVWLPMQPAIARPGGAPSQPIGAINVGAARPRGLLGGLAGSFGSKPRKA